MATCGAMVEGTMVSFGCDLEKEHPGPHRAVENPRSVRDRERWVAEQSHSQSGLGEFQGRAETTAERYTEGATEVPGSTPVIAPGAPEEVVEDQSKAPSEYTHQILAGEVHNPYDESCRMYATVLGKDELGVERCFICRPNVPTKQRDGDQVLPQQTQGEYVQDRILEKARILMEREEMSPVEYGIVEEAMLRSKKVGTERYGTPLQTFNGRDSLQDLVEELRDAFVYGEQLLLAREAERETLIPIAQQEVLKIYLSRVDSNISATPEEHSLAFATAAVDALLKGRGSISP